MIELTRGMSGVAGEADGSNRVRVNLSTNSSGTPCCSASDTAVAIESIRPEIVEPPGHANEDLAWRAIFVHADVDVAIVAADRELVRQRAALVRGDDDAGHRRALGLVSAGTWRSGSSTGTSCMVWHGARRLRAAIEQGPAGARSPPGFRTARRTIIGRLALAGRERLTALAAIAIHRHGLPRPSFQACM